MVQLIEKKVELVKETAEIYSALVALVDAAAAGKKLGLSGLALGIHIGSSGMTPLVAAVDGLGQVPVEAKEALAAFLLTHGEGAGEIAAAVAKLIEAKAPEAAPAPAVEAPQA